MTEEPHWAGAGWSLAGGLLVYVLSAILIYWLFYANNPYDWRAESGATAFKVWFWAAFGTHQSEALLATFLLARILRAPFVATLATAALIMGFLALPLLWWLSFMNACNGPSSFPLELSC